MNIEDMGSEDTMTDTEVLDTERRERPGRGRGPLVFLLGFLAGVVVMTAVSMVILRRMQDRIPGTPAVSGGGDASAEEQQEAVTDDAVSKLRLLEKYISSYYYNMDSVTSEQLQDGMYKGLVSSLNDPYSTYYNAEELADVTTQTEGLYGGVGATLQKNEESGLAEIVGLIKDAPAERTGLRVGDLIYKVDDTVCTSEMELLDVTKMIRGEPDTDVRVTVIREGETEEIVITRAMIELPTVSSEMKEDGIGYLAITEFDDVTEPQFKAQMAELKSQGMKALILDLRGNPGGNVSTVTAIAEELLPKGLVFYMEDRYGNRKDYPCKGADFDLPLIVLVDGSSASAAEILSGAIQDAGIGRLVGTKTFGKGIVQTIYPFKDGSGIKLTIAGYYTRGGRDIHKQGIDPDVEIEFDADRYYEGDGVDNQLEKAMELLREELGQ